MLRNKNANMVSAFCNLYGSMYKLLFIRMILHLKVKCFQRYFNRYVSSWKLLKYNENDAAKL